MITTPLLPAHPSDRSVPVAPPDFPDQVHVVRGCYISTLAYLARFRTEYPTERAEAVTVELAKFHGHHTVAIVSWRGQWWGRDEFFGVFAIDVRVARAPIAGPLMRQVARALDEHAARVVSNGRGEWATPPKGRICPADSARFAHLAATLLPVSTELYWVGGERDEVPLLLFRPAPRIVCVYDPNTGTAQAETEATHGPGLAKAFAAQLGYPAITVRPDLAHALHHPTTTTASLVGSEAKHVP